MNLYNRKQRTKLLLFVIGVLVIGVSIWYAGTIVSSIKKEEINKIELWTKAIQQKAKLVKTTDLIFNQLSEEEFKKVDLWKDAVNLLASSENIDNISFAVKVIQNNTTVPIILTDGNNKILQTRNLDPKKENDSLYLDSILNVMKNKYPPISIRYDKGRTNYLFYMNSNLFVQLQQTMDELIQSFISEIVINSASVPVLLTDSTQTKVLRYGNINSDKFSDENVESLIEKMRNENTPQRIELSNNEVNYIFYEDSETLKKIKLYPIVQFSIIGLFFIVSYLLFSAFKRAEQNSVWVGMAKETAHQLGTPLSSLMAWTEVLRDDLPEETIVEIEKDINRLNTVTERFSKIGSMPKLDYENIEPIMESITNYIRKRASKKIQIETNLSHVVTKINRPLFEWVIENIAKNAIDASKGKLSVITFTLFKEKGKCVIEISDQGEGIPKNKLKTIFEPGYTTKERGWGLGLSLSKRIIDEYHNGKIYVKESELDSGTTFRIEL